MRRSGVPAGTSGVRRRFERSMPRCLPVLERVVRLQQVDAADQILEPRDAERGHDLAHVLGDEEEELDHVLGLPAEALAQLGVLRGDADRARVQVAGAHHHAAHGDQRRGGEAHLVGAEQRGDHDVAARLQLAVGLHPDARAQVVQHERLLRLREPDLPRHAGVHWIDETGDAPVPPSWPEMSTWSAFAFATPAATVPTPTSATSFTEMRASGFAQRRS